MTLRYREYRFYSAEFDAPAVRLSVADARGQEYYAIVERGRGRNWRQRRDWALQCLSDAIRMGWPPGLVGIRAMPDAIIRGHASPAGRERADAWPALPDQFATGDENG